MEQDASHSTGEPQTTSHISTTLDILYILPRATCRLVLLQIHPPTGNLTFTAAADQERTTKD